MVSGQQPGALVPEESPSFVVNIDGNKTRQVAVLDANWRWLHLTGGYKNCNEGGNNNTWICGDERTCATRCSLEGVSARAYEDTYGIRALPTGLELRYVSKINNVGSRSYLSHPEDHTYHQLMLKNRQLSVDVDVSELPCGLNGALYLVRMTQDERLAAYGVGYGDAQCPKDLKFVDGLANFDGKTGSCATEIDLIEANSQALAWTLHACRKEGPCRGNECETACDKPGADSNSYREGHRDFYGPTKVLDSSKPFTAVTQFLTADGTDTGDLVEIKRFYVQSGIKIVPPRDSITDLSAAEQFVRFGEPNTHKQNGGMASLSKTMDKGLVLVFSIWDDPVSGMKWLDSVYAGSERGPCSAESTTTSVAALRRQYGHVKARFTNISIVSLATRQEKR